MKTRKYIGLAGCLLAAGPMGAQISSLEELDPEYGVVIERIADNGGSNEILYGQNDGQVWKAVSPESTENRYWAVYTSPQTGRQFVYHVALQQFMTLTDQGCVLQDKAVPMTLMPAARTGSWLLANDTRIAGLTTDRSAILLNRDEETVSEGMAFALMPSTRKLTESELKTLQDKVKQAEQTERAELLTRIRNFLKEARETEAGALPGFAGTYRYSELEKACNVAPQYTNRELEDLLAETKRSIYPQENKYYRLMNTTRPDGSTFTGNVLSVVDRPNVDGPMNLAGTPDGNQLPGTRKGDVLESLSLFRFTGTGIPGVFCLNNPGMGVYAGGNGSNGAHLPLVTDIREAVPYEVVYEGAQNYRLRNTRYPDFYITLNDEANAVSYNQLEDPELWYLEEVKHLDVEIGESGYTSLCLPCPIELPEEIEAYVAVEQKKNVLILRKLKDFTQDGTVLPAFTAVILKTSPENAGTVYRCALSEREETPVDNLLKGVTRHTTLPEGSFILGDGQLGVGFYPVADNDRTLAGNRAYLPAESTGGQKQLKFYFDETPTGIGTPQQGEDNGEDVWFDLDGKRKINGQKGLFISKKGIKKYMEK